MKKGWEVKPLGNICDFRGGGTPSKSVARYWSGDIPWVSPKDMKSDVITDSIDHVTDEAIANSSASLIPAGAVLVVVRSGILNRTIPLGIAGRPLSINQDVKALCPSQDLNPNFLFYFLRSKEANILGMVGRGATVHRLLADQLRKIPVPIPPLPEQRRIVAILDEAFEGIAAAKANAEKNLRNAREACDAAAASRLEQATADHPIVTVAELALPQKGSIRTGPFGSQLLHSEFVEDGVAVLGIDNAVANEFQWGKRRFITHDKYRSLERYKVHPGDVVITIMGTCGRCAVIPDDIPLSINSKHLCCVSLDRSKCLPAFLHAYFLTHPKARQYLADQASGSIMDGLNMGIIKEMPVQLPPVGTQADVVLSLNALKDAKAEASQCFQAKINILDELKSSLLHQAFTGQL